MKTIVVFFLLTSCASLESSTQMENRTYDMCVDKASQPTCDGFCYQDNVCVKKFLGICINKEIQVVDKIPMSIPQPMCKTLFDKNFVLNARKMPI